MHDADATDTAPFAIKLAAEPSTRRYRVPTTAYVRPCLNIAAEAFESGGGLNTIADRYAMLTSNLPLAGGKTMRVGQDGEIALIRRLRTAAPWLEPAIAKIELQLRIQNWAGRPWIAWRPLCLVGPPGCGKSYLARLIGELARTGHATLDFAGTSDNRTLEGTARGWNSAQPCWPAVVMNQTLTANPVLVVEEAEKAGGSAQNGRPLHTLLNMIEAESARKFYDKCLLAEIDISHACWILTANSTDGLPAPLRSRLDIVEVRNPEPAHFDALVRAITSNLAKRWSVSPAMMPDLPPQVLATLREVFLRTRSVRKLRRHIETLVAALVPFERGPTN